MSGAEVTGAISSFVSVAGDQYKVSVKSVGIQVALMSGISIGTILAFSFFRPREKKVYAPKIKYQLPPPENPLDDPDYEPPPPAISNGFFAWLSPVIRLDEEQMVANIGLDAATFLRFLRLLRHSFTIISILSVALMVVNIIYNLRYVDSSNRNGLSLLTIQNVGGSWVWPALGGSYLFNFVVMYFVWRHWQAMIQLRSRWFRSPAYQTKVYSRTLMVTQIRKDYRSDQGLLALMGLLKVDGIKIGPEIDCTTIGRRLDDFPELVEEHNKAVAELEEYLVKYLKNGQMGAKRPTMKIGSTLGIGGQRKDAIDHLARQVKFLRDKVDAKRQHIDSLLKQERRARKSGHPTQRVEGENYGFVTFKTIAEAHRIARTHQGKLKELFGARLQLAPMPHDIVWDNIPRESAEVQSRKAFGFFLIGMVCFFNTVPVLVVTILANLSALAAYVSFLNTWRNKSSWTFSIISGVLPSIVSAIFGYLLPVLMRKISKYQGAPTRSRLDRAVTARYFAFMIISNLIVFSLLSVFYNLIAQIVDQIGHHVKASVIFDSFKNLPKQVQGSYVQQSTYWLTYMPLRGFLVIFELIQLFKLAMVSIRRFMFSHTPRDIRDMTKPEYFDYPVIIVNLLFVAAVGIIYAPLAPLVVMFACAVFWFSSIVYKYQLLYVFISRAESGGRMWNVYVNRLLACFVLMQLLMVLTTGLIRTRWLDAIAAVPPLILMIAFKIWIRQTAGQKFKYFEPTPAEAEEMRAHAVSEKRLRQSEMEKRFLHPALQADKLFTVMVHKSQEALAREVLSAYPWFAGKGEHDGIKVKAVKEENLEYDPLRDGPRDEAHQAEWDARSVASGDLLGGGRSEVGSVPSTPMYEYGGYALPAPGTSSYMSAVNESTENLIPGAARRGEYFQAGSQVPQPQRKQSRPYQQSRLGAGEADAPLLYHEAAMGEDTNPVPYPPSAFQSPPHGYTPPTMRRSGSDVSDTPQTRWDNRQDSNSDIGQAYGRQQQGSPASYHTLPPQHQYQQPGAYQNPYDDPYSYESRRSSPHSRDNGMNDGGNRRYGQ